MDYQADPSLASLRSSILQHKEENGHTYHAMSSGSKSGVPSATGVANHIITTSLCGLS